MAGSARAATITSVVFVVAFVAGAALVGDLAGEVGEADDTFVEYFESGSNRAEALAGSFLLVVAALAFLYFTQLLAGIASSAAPEREPTVALVRSTGTLSGVGMFVAALALMTVPLSLSFGEAFDTIAFGEGQAVLPQFGYVALTVGAMFPAAVMIVAFARLGLLPGWLTWLTYLIAVLLVVTSLMVSPMFVLLPTWVVLTALVLRRQASKTGAG